MAKFKKLSEIGGRISYLFPCPGCDCQHQIFTGEGPGPSWSFNGDLDRPTCSPSLLVKMGPEYDPVTHLAKKGAPGRVCHSFIKDGMIQFLGDCTHSLAGRTVEIPEVE